MALVIINPDTPEDIQNSLRDLGHSPLEIPRCNEVALPIQGHPDLQICFVKKHAIYQPLISEDFLNEITPYVSLIKGRSRLGKDYPQDIPFNIIVTEKGALHLKSETDPLIKDTLQSYNIPLFNIKQGYGKCSTAIVNENSLITSDKGIYNIALSMSLNVLLIDPGYIDLPGYKYGFIGGATGNDSTGFYVSGTLNDHPHYNDIVEFVSKCNRQYIELSKNRAIDLGSFFFIEKTPI